MKNQKKHGDGLIFMEKVYNWGILRRVIFFFANLVMLKKTSTKDGREMRRMPFRKALKRDVWEPSERAVEIGNEWKESETKPLENSSKLLHKIYTRRV